MAMTTDVMSDSAVGDPRLQPGTKVEVRRKFDAKWARGFTIVDVSDTGYRLRRASDGNELPVEFGFDEVRREHKRDMWWI